MNLLLSGPPASGKTARALEQFTATADSILITPTATMAEHLGHELARRQLAVRPSRIQTLAGFADACGAPPAAPRFLVYILIEEALEKLPPARFDRVRAFAGVHAELAKLLEELPDPGAVRDGELKAVFAEVEARLAAGGFALRNRRLHAAAERIRTGLAQAPGLAILDGFFTLRAGELDLIRALAGRASVTVTAPETWALPGFEVRRLEAVRRRPERVLFSAATPEREAEEIARRILEHAAQGRPFREAGIVMRSREPYARLVETTLKRFGIPARSYFLDPLGAHPAIAYMAGMVRALLAGWDHAAVNALLRMPVSGVGATAGGDRFDFALREALPGRGLPIGGIREQPALLDELQKLSSWKRDKQDATEWAARFQGLAVLAARPVFGEALEREEVDAARSTAQALRKFGEVAAQVAAFFGAGKVGLEAMWKRMETALAVETLPPQDRRRDVVHVMDVFEARQWELPVAFLCGLAERVFPKYHGENPVLGDAERRRLGLPASADLEAQERALFEMAATRATAQTVFSYPRFDEKGEETLRSFFLNGVDAAEEGALRVRPQPRREVTPAERGPVRVAASKHHRLSASSIEDFLQCPFKFFARKTLKLRERPAAPRDRLDVLAQGIILHRALAEYWRAPLLGIEVLDQVFERECVQKRIPRTYRTEAVRLELLRHFERFTEDRQVELNAELGWSARVEEEFEFELQPGLSIRGRIDRLEVSRGKQALVIDYKYSAQVKGRVKEAEAGGSVQGGLYLLAAERSFGLEPAGMLYCGLKGGVEWQGWHVPSVGLDAGTSCTAAVIRELMDNAAQRAIETREGILAGRVEAHPADPKKCGWCDFRDICRVEAMEKERASGAGK